jgi:hypothetical protein
VDSDDPNCTTKRLIKRRRILAKFINIMEKLLKKISRHKKVGEVENKQRWYKVGRLLLKGETMNRHKETKLAAKRTYIYYKVGKGDWEGPTPRKLSKIPEYKFAKLLKRREEAKRGTLLENDFPSDPISRDRTREQVSQEVTRPQEEPTVVEQSAESFVLEEAWDWWDLQGVTPNGCGI